MAIDTAARWAAALSITTEDLPLPSLGVTEADRSLLVGHYSDLAAGDVGSSASMPTAFTLTWFERLPAVFRAYDQ